MVTINKEEHLTGTQLLDILTSLSTEELERVVVIGTSRGQFPIRDVWASDSDMKECIMIEADMVINRYESMYI